MTRFKAYSHEHLWVGRIENDSDHEASDWQVHPGQDTYGYVISDRFFVEFGPGGSERLGAARVRARPLRDDPQGCRARQGNAGGAANDGVIVQVGEGPVTVNVDGSDPA